MSLYIQPLRPRGGGKLQLYSFFYLVVDGVGGQRYAAAALYRRGRPGTHCTGGWVGPRAGLDGCGKLRSLPGFDPRSVQPVASRYASPSDTVTEVI